MTDRPDRLRILLVDGEPSRSCAVAERLEREDDRFDVVAGASAADGFGRLGAGTVDCVLVDYDSTDWRAVVDEVGDVHPELPVVLYADAWDAGAAAEAVSDGVTDYAPTSDGPDGLVLLADRVWRAVERVRADRAVDAVQERYQALLEHAAGALCVLDERGRFTYVNRAWSDQIGFASTALAGQPAIEHVHPDDRDAVVEAFERVVANPDETATTAFRARVAENGWLWIDTRFRNVADEPVAEGAVALVQTTFGRPEEERELALFRQLLDHSTDEIYVIDPQTARLVDANGTACERLGYSRDELLSLRVPDVAAGIELDEWPEHARTVREEGGVVFLANHVRRDGSTYPVEVNVVHVEGADAEYMVSINRDLSEHQAQERELLRYRAIVESMDDAVFMLAPDGTYAYVNEAAAANTPLSREEIVGTHFTDVLESGLLAEEDRHDEYVDLVEALLSGERSTGRRVMEIETPEGERRTLDAELTEITSSQEGRLGVAGVTRDITERIAYQQELERQNERLEEFANVLSHDLRNPLNVAEARVRMALEERDSRDLTKASGAHERMRTLIEDLLALARTGGSVGRTEPVALRDVVEQCSAMVETTDASIAVDDDRRLRAHPGRLEQLFENLVRNALEHGGEAVTITAGGLDDGFYVADDGRGIPAAERDRVFDSGYSTSEDGTGFGLAIVCEIADAHGWTVRATESADGGARFEFTGVESADR